MSKKTYSKEEIDNIVNKAFLDIKNDFDRQQVCKYCNFKKTKTYFPSKELMETAHYDGNVKAIGAGLQLDMDGAPCVGIFAAATDIGIQTGFNINFCPMCGRKLVGNDARN